MKMFDEFWVLTDSFEVPVPAAQYSTRCSSDIGREALRRPKQKAHTMKSGIPVPIRTGPTPRDPRQAASRLEPLQTRPQAATGPPVCPRRTAYSTAAPVPAPLCCLCTPSQCRHSQQFHWSCAHKAIESIRDALVQTLCMSKYSYSTLM